MKPRATYQFTLRRVMVAITIISAVLAFAIWFPIATAEFVTVDLLLIAPSAIVLGIAFWLSENRRRTTIILTAGIILGWLVSPRVFVSWSRPPTFWDEFKIDFVTIGLFMFGGAIGAAVLDVIVALTNHKSDAEQSRITNG